MAVSRRVSTKLKRSVHELLKRNRRHSKNYTYTLPSLETYPYQWFWDSCFHAIILSHLDLSAAKAELRSLLPHQFLNGMFPHMVYWERQPGTQMPVPKDPGRQMPETGWWALDMPARVRRIAWGRRSTSTITQPPMLAYAVWQIYEKDGDHRFLEEMYQPMHTYYDFFFRERDPQGHSLIGIINPDESGEDNSPRFDNALQLPPQHDAEVHFNKRLELIERNKKCRFRTHCMRNFYWVRDIPINVVLVKNLEIMSRIAAELNKMDDSERLMAQAHSVRQAMRTFMLKKDGIMYSTYGLNYRRIPVKTWAMFAPLFANIYTAQEANNLIDKHLKNETEFKLAFSVPTVAKNEASYDPTGFWRGPVWIGTNWFIYHGLKNYGYEPLANRIADHSVRLLEKSGFREYFHPETGKGLGAHEFTWGGLILDMD